MFVPVHPRRASAGRNPQVKPKAVILTAVGAVIAHLVSSAIRASRPESASAVGLGLAIGIGAAVVGLALARAIGRQGQI